MKLYIVIFLCLVNYLSNSQTIIVPKSYDYASTKSFEDVFKEFVKKSKIRSPAFFKYYVYVVYITKSKDERNDTCIILSYIMNDCSFEYIGADYLCSFEDELVLFRFDSSIRNHTLEKFNLKPIDFEEYKLIKNKLSSPGPNQVGGIYGTSRALVYYRNKGKSKTEFFEDSDKLPSNKQFWKYFPTGGEVEVIKEGK